MITSWEFHCYSWDILLTRHTNTHGAMACMHFLDINISDEQQKQTYQHWASSSLFRRQRQNDKCWTQIAEGGFIIQPSSCLRRQVNSDNRYWFRGKLSLKPTKSSQPLHGPVASGTTSKHCKHLCVYKVSSTFPLLIKCLSFFIHARRRLCLNIWPTHSLKKNKSFCKL